MSRPAAAEPPHAASLFVVREGRRAQGMRVGPGQRIGVYQRIGTNPDWAYQLTAGYDLDEAGTAGARLWVDPTGGTTPARRTWPGLWRWRATAGLR
ncbi:MAG TPA: hypothetical protein VEO01_09400 [Pseudonocardiaceae bacterium]|nr:hypothetical protein [Pseudonocardiaceae bacterium]